MLTIVKVLRDGRRLEAWLSGGDCKTFTPALAPYFWSLDELASGEWVKRRLLSNPSELVDVKQVKCGNVYGVKARSTVLDNAMENGVRYKDRLAQDLSFLQKDTDTTDAAFDIEIEATGQFPRAEKNPINAIALFSRRVQKVWTTHDMPEYEVISRLSDHIVKEINPDVLGTYSGTALDYDYTADRAAILDIDFPLGRRGDRPYTKIISFTSGKRKGVDKTTYLSGRICFDLYKEARYDTSLSGVRRGLKDVCRFLFGDKYIIEVDRQRMQKLSRDELGAYCFSDARITYMLLEHYLGLLKPVAKKLKVPLDMVINRKPSHIGNWVYGRAFNDLGIISDGANFERFVGLLW